MGDRRLALGAEGTLSGNWQGLALFVLNSAVPASSAFNTIWTDH